MVEDTAIVATLGTLELYRGIMLRAMDGKWIEGFWKLKQLCSGVSGNFRNRLVLRWWRCLWRLTAKTCYGLCNFTPPARDSLQGAPR
ncbi:hypothetical protein KCP73_11125 [Salmonella enterica subsp. enterica]|nr:hypothetical protein KCP73_11125 [Salmonella enterica subsp. enterica]